MQLELDGLAGPVREAPGGEQPAEGFFQGVVLAFGDGADVFGPGFLAQRFQDRGEAGGTAGGQVAAQAAGAAQGGGQPQTPAGEPVTGVAVRPGRAAADLLRQLRQAGQVRAAGRGGERARRRSRGARAGAASS